MHLIFLSILWIAGEVLHQKGATLQQMAKCKLCHRTTRNTGCSQDNNISIWNVCEVPALKECPLNFANETSLKTHMRATKCLTNMGSTVLNSLDFYYKKRAFQQGFRYFNRSLQHFIPFRYLGFTAFLLWYFQSCEG